MRKTYVDDLNMIEQGSARKWSASVCFYNRPGSLYFNRRVLIEPRFEIHLKASYDAIKRVENYGEQKLYGFTMYISGNQNYVNSLGHLDFQGAPGMYSKIYDDVGYNNFRNALIIEFDFEKDYNDPAANSFSIRYCDKSCKADDKIAIVSKPLNYQGYSPGKRNDWDFRLVYNRRTISLYAGNTFLHSVNFDLKQRLGTNIAFVGFTGFMASNRAEVSLFGTFICEDNYELSRMQGWFYEGGRTYSERNYGPGQTINYAIYFIDNANNYVPHAFNERIWDYTFFVTHDCENKKYYVTKKIDDYSLLITLPACSKVGRHSIRVNEVLKGSAPVRYYNVVPGPLNKINLIGYDGAIKNVPLKNDRNSFYLNYGKSKSGDFLFQYNLRIVLDFSFVDSHGNPISYSNPASLFSLKKVNSNGSTSGVNNNALRMTVERRGNNYQMILIANQVGTFQIDKNSYMERPIKFNIIQDEPNPSRSHCTLEGYSSNPTVKTGIKLSYKCILIDSYGNNIALESFRQNSIYEFTCQIGKTWPNSAKINPRIISGGSTDNFYRCEYTTSMAGNFDINGYLMLKSNRGSLTRISSKINQFFVRGSANTYIIKKIYDKNANKWIDINNFKNTQIQHKPDSSGLITYLDFAEADGNILISQYNSYPNDFRLGDLSIQLYSTHDEKFGFVQPNANIVKISGKPYIGIYQVDTKKTGKVIMKASFDYILKFRYIKNEKSATLKYFPNFNQYKTCFHPLDLKKTEVKIANIINLSNGGAETKIGTIILKTSDNFLYNYNIGTNNFAFQLEINVNIKFRVVALSIEGTYEVYVKCNQEYQGEVKIKIKNQEVKIIRLQSGPAQACNLNWLDAKSFKQLKATNKEIYYEYIGNMNEGNLLIEFKLLDKYNTIIANSEYYKKFDDISSEQYGTNKKYFSIEYNKKTTSYKFRDNIPYDPKTRGWVFTLRERTCNKKIYVRYDGKKGGPPLKLENSYFKLLNTQIDINQEAYVEVIYKDKNNQLLGLQKQKLIDLISKTEVSASKNNKKQFILQYQSTTSNHALRFKTKFTDSGEFIIAATSNKVGLKYEKTNKLTVINTIYSLPHCKLVMIIDKVIDMNPKVKVQIKNTEAQPVYKLYFYTKENRKTNYDKNKDYTLYIPVGKDAIKLQQNKKNADFIEFTFPKSELEYFRRIKKGDYNLILSDGKEKVSYQLYLLADNNNDYSNERDYSISHTEVKPTLINGIAGNTYTINIELRASDGKRWNGDVELSNFKVSQTQVFKNSNEYNIQIGKAAKKGQIAVQVRQTIVTNNKANILSFKYKNQDIPKKVSLNICNAELKNLLLISGPTSGNVINPPKITFKPVDAYNNLYSDLFKSKLTKDKLDALTIGKSKEKVALTSNNALANGQYLTVQYSSKVSTNVIVSSQYLQKAIEYRINSGPIHKDNSYAEVKKASTKVGDNYVIQISPKDIYNNNVDGLSKNDLKQFEVVYKTVNGKDEVKVNDCKLINNNFNIECSVKITKAGNFKFVVKYIKNEISCKNKCEFSVIPTTMNFKNTKTLYTNKNTYLTPSKANTVEIKTIPKFEVSFYDDYNNQLDTNIVKPFRISATLEGTEVKLCISNNGKTKLITVCPPSNGDDNENVWKYLTNGNHYKLNIQNMANKKETIIYPITLTGGGTGSSSPYDISKTQLSKTSLTLIAGKQDKITMTLMTTKLERKNYWYPSPNEKIKITFEKDASTCSSNVEKADLPGKYDIKITCTKVTTLNKFSIAVEKKTVPKKVNLVVQCNVAYSLEVQNPKQFTVSGDKYTWAKNPSNDDVITFSYLFKDKYQNIITNDIRKLNQYTINSDKFGTKTNYYSISNMNNKYIYTFTDKINQALTKHIWTIKILDSKRIYSFIYNKIPGAPDLSKSSWTIDKNSYIIKDTATINVYLVDKYGVNLGTENGRLNKEKGSVTVIAKKAKDISLAVNSLASNYIKYTYTFPEVGTYKISVKYNGKLIGKEKNVLISYQTVDIKKSKLYYNIDNKNDNLMQTSTPTNINSLKNYPFYKLYFYTSDGKLITLYDKSATMSCVMTYGSISWKMDIKKEDSYIKLTYTNGFQEKFQKLPLGLYHIEINYKNTVSKYPLYLLGEKDVSPSNNYDLSKTYIKPFEIEAVAGVEKEIDIEFRASDGLRWNYPVNLASFGLSNSLKLKDPQFKYRLVKGSKNGQIKLYVKQTVTTAEKKNNILTLTYASKSISQTISLKVKSSALKSIKYISGIVDGTVISPPTAKFIPYDEFGNVCTQIFDKAQYPQTKLNQLVSGASINKFVITTNIYAKDGYLCVQYGCQNVTTIKITSKYFKETYSYKLLSGPIESTTSYAQLLKDKGVLAGDLSTLNIIPKDKFNNDISSLTKKDISSFEVQYSVNGGSSENIINSCSINKNLIICKTNINKSGEVKLAIEYKDKAIKCGNCKFTVSPNVLDFSQTKVINKITNKEMSKSALNVLTVSANPLFELSFYDKFMNSIIDKTQVNKLNVKTTIEVTDIKLCVETSNLIKKSQLCKSAGNDENEERWKYIPNGNKYKLSVSANNQNLIYPIQIIGGYNDGSSGPIDVSKTNISPTSLTLTAGIEGVINVELRTKERIRKNYWYVNIANHLKAKVSDNNCLYTISKGAQPGQYKFKFTCKKKSDSIKTTIVVENTDLTTIVNIKVVPDKPASSKLYYTNNKEVKVKDLPTVSVEGGLQLINELYDKYNNLITNINFSLSTLNIQIAPSIAVKNYKYSAETVAQKNGKVLINIKSTYAGEHYVTGALLPLQKYIIKFTHGSPSAENSILEVSKKEAWVGEKVKIYITPYDKYFNLIDANEYKKTSPYQLKYTNYGNNAKIIIKDYTIETVNKINVLSYSGAFYVKGYADFYGYINNASIKSVSNRINIKSKDIDFKSSLIVRYNFAKNEKTKIEDEDVERNTYEEPVYRIYPRDIYLNDIDYIPDDKLNKYQARFISQNLTKQFTYELILNNKGKKNQQYAEFVIYNNPNYIYTYATLPRGYYTLLFTDGTTTVTYNIYMLGNEYETVIGIDFFQASYIDQENLNFFEGEKDYLLKGKLNEENFQKTSIREQNLDFLAGESGYIVLELRSYKNIRMNDWNYDIKVKSCDEKDTTFDATSEKAGLPGIFQITITTKKANTYPNLEKCPLKIYVNNILIKRLHPEMKVSPNEITKTTILNDYYKKNSDTELKDGNTDNNYIFEVSSFDQYNNLAETDQETIDLKVSLEGEDIDKITSETDTSTGYRKYFVTATKSGNYVVSTSKSGPQGIYLGKEASFLINPGAIDLTKTVIKEKSNFIQAGEKPEISISAFDQYENALQYTDFMDKFVVIFNDANNKEFISNPSYDEDANKVYYKSDNEITIIGNVTSEVTYDNKEVIDTSDITIEIIPGDPYPPNSILSQELDIGEQIQYFNQNKIEIDTTQTLRLNVSLYDKYKNYVNVLPVSAEILNPIMSGKNMKEIKFNVRKDIDNFDLDFNENDEYNQIYKNLVKGIYDLTLSVKTDLGESKFIYKLEVTSGDDLHGNGDVDYSKCVLSPLEKKIIAGNYEQFTLELRTKEGLLYNGDIDINKDLKIYLDTADNSFQYSVIKAGDIYGIYNITIYSEKKGEYALNVELNNKKLTQIKYTVTPQPIPEKNYTKISSKPKDEVYAGEFQYIKFSLYDKYSNRIEKSDNIINIDKFSLYKNGVNSAYSSLNFESNTDLRVTFMANYPPKKILLNLLYEGAYIFEKDIEISVKTIIDYSSTSISSTNKEKIYEGEFLDMSLFTVDKNGECAENDDYHSQFKVEVRGPLKSSKEYITTYQLERTDKTNSECNNEYHIVVKEENRYKYAGDYIISVYAKNDLIAQFNQICYPSSDNDSCGENKILCPDNICRESC